MAGYEWVNMNVLKSCMRTSSDDANMRWHGSTGKWESSPAECREMAWRYQLWTAWFVL